jgi:hypothetical protein
MDPSARMLEEFRARAEALGVAVTAIEGTWPESAAEAPVADVVVCHHVAYNVPDLATFARGLTDHARYRVVMELTAGHPLSVLNDLWLRFHSLERPTSPTADDALSVLRELGLAPHAERWFGPAVTSFARREDLVAWTRRRLCLPAARDSEIDAALAAQLTAQPDGTASFPPRSLVTLWWTGAAADPTP